MILNFFIFAFLTACVSHLWDMCLQENMIFGWLGNKLHYSKAWHAKPLGGCVICANVWHALWAWILLSSGWGFDLERVGYGLAFIALSNFMVRVMGRVI